MGKAGQHQKATPDRTGEPVAVRLAHTNLRAFDPLDERSHRRRAASGRREAAGFLISMTAEYQRPSLATPPTSRPNAYRGGRDRRSECATRVAAVA